MSIPKHLYPILIITFLSTTFLLSCTFQLNKESPSNSAPDLIQNPPPENSTPSEQSSTNSLPLTPEAKINLTTSKPQQSSENKTPPTITAQQTQKSWYQPTPHTSWQWQLTGDINTNYQVQMYDIDLFETTKETITQLHMKGIKVICYFSAGTYEPYRKDASLFPKSIIGNALEDWPDERWLDISQIPTLKPIIISRLDLAKQKGCDGVEPDNVDGYQNNNGFDLTAVDQQTYNIFLATEAHKRNLAVGLKNDLDQIKELEPHFDFAINEQCFEYDECDQLLPFIKNNKAVFGVEYKLSKNEFCQEANNLNFDWLKMDYELDGKRDACR